MLFFNSAAYHHDFGVYLARGVMRDDWSQKGEKNRLRECELDHIPLHHALSIFEELKKDRITVWEWEQPGSRAAKGIYDVQLGIVSTMLFSSFYVKVLDESLDDAVPFTAKMGQRAQENAEGGGINCKVWKAIFFTAEELINFAGTDAVFHAYLQEHDMFYNRCRV